MPILVASVKLSFFSFYVQLFGIVNYHTTKCSERQRVRKRGGAEVGARKFVLYDVYLQFKSRTINGKDVSDVFI